MDEERQVKVKPFRLRRRRDGLYSSKYLGGEDILVELTGDGTWDIYQEGPTDSLGLWRNRPSEKRVPRKGILGLLGLKKWVPVSPKNKIRSSEVRELHFLSDDSLGKDCYRDVELPPPAAVKAWKALHYEVKIRFEKDSDVIDCRVRIRGRSKRAIDEVKVDFGSFPGSLMVSTRDGLPAKFTHDEEGLTVFHPLKAEQEFTLDVNYRGEPRPMSHPAVPADLGWLRRKGSVVTFNGVDRSSSWIPGDDDPANKAPYEFKIEVPKQHFAVANGTLEKIVEGPRSRTFHYSCKQPMASYLASVNCFPERDYRKTELYPGFQVVHPKGMEEHLRKDFINHPRMMKFLTERLGPYPFDAYGALVADLPADTYNSRFSDGMNTFEADVSYQIAFEAQTRPIYPRQSLKGRTDFEPTIIHELAHQWFGNAVTKAREQDIWVNEAFPSYSGSLWMEQLHGHRAMSIEVEDLYMRVDHHQFSDIMANPDREKLFSQENYARMALSMHALRRKLGDRQFYQTLAGIVEEHKYTSITVDQMVATAQRLNQGQLGDFFQSWLYSKEVPFQ